MREQLRRILVLTFMGLMASTVSGCQKPAGATYDARAMAEQAAAQVGTVTDFSQGSQGAPVFIFPENHSLRRGHMEEAVSLMRLNGKAKLAGIVLEGMAPGTDLTGVTKLTPGVAAGLLREGEISSAEFMRSAYGTDLLSGETELSARTTDPGDVGLCSALARAAAADMMTNGMTNGVSLDQAKAHLTAMMAAEKAFGGAFQTAERSKTCASIQAANRAHKAWTNSVGELLSDSDKLKPLAATCSTNQSMTMQIDDELTIVDAAIAAAGTAPDIAGPQTVDQLNAYKTALSARNDASDEMIRQAVALSGQNKGPVAIIIGAAHTGRVTEGLKAAGLTYAVIENKALKIGDTHALPLPNASVGRKYETAPALDNPLNRMVHSKADLWPHCDASDAHNPPTVIDKPWFAQGKAKVYEAVADYAGYALYGRARNGGAAGIIDEKKARRFLDAKGQVKAVMFPVLVASHDPDGPPREVYIVAQRGNVFADGDVEKELLQLAGDDGNGEPPDDGHYTAQEPDGPKPDGPKGDKPSKEAREKVFSDAFPTSDIKMKSYTRESEAAAYAQAQ